MTHENIPQEARSLSASFPVDLTEVHFLFRTLTAPEKDALKEQTSAVYGFFGPHFDAAQQALEAAEGAADKAEVEYEADPRVVEYNRLLRGDGFPEEEFPARHAEVMGLNSVVQAAGKVAFDAENHRHDILLDWLDAAALAGFLLGQVQGAQSGLELAASFKTEPDKWEPLGGAALVLTRMLTDNAYTFARIYHLMAAKQPPQPEE